MCLRKISSLSFFRLGDLGSTQASIFSACLLGLSSKTAFNPRSLSNGIFINFLDKRAIALPFLSQILLLSKAKISVAIYNRYCYGLYKALGVQTDS